MFPQARGGAAVTSAPVFPAGGKDNAVVATHRRANGGFLELFLSYYSTQTVKQTVEQIKLKKLKNKKNSFSPPLFCVLRRGAGFRLTGNPLVSAGGKITQYAGIHRQERFGASVLNNSGITQGLPKDSRGMEYTKGISIKK